MVYWNRTGDPESDFAAYDAAMNEEAAKFPECEECGCTIWEGERYVEIRGKYYHMECLNDIAETMGDCFYAENL